MFYKSYTLGSIYTSWRKTNESLMDPNREPTIANLGDLNPFWVPDCSALKLWLNVCIKCFSS